MPANDILLPVPHSIGQNRPDRLLPLGACDSHMHIFDSRYAPSPHWQRRPPDAPVSAYRCLQRRLGTSRAVIVTPSTYGTDNRCTLDALAQMGDAARGIAVVDADVDGAELVRLAALGVRGLRVNFVTPQSWGTTSPDMLDVLARKIADQVECADWHVQIFAHPEQIVSMELQLATLPVPLVIDHMGRIDPSTGTTAHGLETLLRLLEKGKTWVKLSGAYMRSKQPQSRYADTEPLGQVLVRAAPHRMVWGSDWPHTTEPPDTVNDADLVNLLRVWCGKDDVMDRILVDNPQKLYGFAACKTAGEVVA